MPGGACGGEEDGAGGPPAPAPEMSYRRLRAVLAWANLDRAAAVAGLRKLVQERDRLKTHLRATDHDERSSDPVLRKVRVPRAVPQPAELASAFQLERARCLEATESDMMYAALGEAVTQMRKRVDICTRRANLLEDLLDERVERASV